MIPLKIGRYETIQHQQELDFLLNAVKGKNGLIEIGTYKGGMFYALSKVINGVHISIDLMYSDAFKQEYEERNKNLKEDIKGCQLIYGNSHSKEIYDKIKQILKGKTIDVLFIDGDHSSEGVTQDYEMYREFVSEGGIIAFHDIIKSDFHKKHLCFVDRFWDKLIGIKYSKCVSQEWGGIGYIINTKKNWKCYQIYYNEETKKGLLPCFEPYFNEKKNTVFYENDVILDIYKRIDSINEDYIGTTSHKFSEKTQLKSFEFEQLVNKNIGTYDVILFPHAKFLNENVVERNKKFYSSIYKLMEIFDEENIFPFKMCSDKWTCSYCNYWIIKKEVYKDYCKKILIPAINVFKKNKRIKEFCKVNLFSHNSKKILIYPFLLELLMGFYVNKFNIKHIVITPNLSLKLKSNNVWCEVLNKNLMINGEKRIQLPREMADNLQMQNHIKICE